MITDNDLKELLSTTMGCMICGNETRMVIDHCHKDLYVRGVLCNPCNLGLGAFKDDINLLGSAINYLSKGCYKQKSK